MNYETQTPNAQASNMRRIYVFVSSILMCLLIGNIWLAAQLSHVGMYVSVLESRAVELETVNTKLSQITHERASLHELEQKALDLGYTTEVTYQQLLPEREVAQGY